MNNLAIKINEVVKEKSGVSRLTLTDFRNYAYLRINADLSPIILTGENGSGKTNILEALSFLTPGKGLRGAKLTDIKRITPALVNADYINSNESLNWAVSAIIKKNNEEYNIGTGSQKSQREADDEILLTGETEDGSGKLLMADLNTDTKFRPKMSEEV